MAYVQGDPVNYGDPSGLAKCSVTSTTWSTDPSSQDMKTSLEFSCVSTGGQDGKTYSILPGNASAEEIAQELEHWEATVQSAENEEFNSLLMASIGRVKSDLSKPSCQKDFKDMEQIMKSLSNATFRDLGIMKYNANGTSARGNPGVGRSNPFTGSLNLNSRTNWANPGSTLILKGGFETRGDLLGGQSGVLGGASVSAREFMDLTLLHELSHISGAIGNPDRGPGVEKALWRDCIK